MTEIILIYVRKGTSIISQLIDGSEKDYIKIEAPSLKHTGEIFPTKQEHSDFTLSFSQTHTHTTIPARDQMIFQIFCGFYYLSEN